MHFKSIYLQIKHLIFLFLYLFPIFLIGQNQNNFISKVSEDQGLNTEIISLEAKRENLLNRKHQLIIDLDENTDQINRIEEMVSYIDYKLIKLHFQLKIEEDYLNNGKTKKDILSTDEYVKIKQEWNNLNTELKKDIQQKQIELKRSELERLPKERQKKVLSMPERYLIIED
tara:strand:- start:1686 stop:2201 length:516 start_codon:yes stop_codon:yes gene_type:complete